MKSLWITTDRGHEAEQLATVNKLTILPASFKTEFSALSLLKIYIQKFSENNFKNIFSTEYRSEIQEKLHAVRQSQMETGPPSQPILSVPGSTPLVVGPWSLLCKRNGEIRVHNSFISQVSERSF